MTCREAVCTIPCRNKKDVCILHASKPVYWEQGTNGKTWRPSRDENHLWQILQYYIRSEGIVRLLGWAFICKHWGGIGLVTSKKLIEFDTAVSFTCIPTLQQLPFDSCQGAKLDQLAKYCNYKWLVCKFHSSCHRGVQRVSHVFKAGRNVLHLLAHWIKYNTSLC